MKYFIFLGIFLIQTFAFTKEQPSLCDSYILGEVKVEQIQNVLVTCYPNMDINELRIRQMIQSSETRQIQEIAPQTYYNELSFIRNRLENDGTISIFYDIETYSLESGQWIHQVMNPVIHAQNSQKSRLAHLLKFNEGSKEKYYNLKTSTGWMSVPLQVAKQPDCGGLNDCSKGMRYFKISFDRSVLRPDSSAPELFRFEIISSPDVPSYIKGFSEMDNLYLSKEVKACIQDVASNVTNCSQVENFHW